MHSPYAGLAETQVRSSSGSGALPKCRCLPRQGRHAATSRPETARQDRQPTTACNRSRRSLTAGVFRRWEKLREWIAAEREFLVWRNGLDTARRSWQATPDGSKNDALLMGIALAQGSQWLKNCPEDIPELDRKFIMLSRRAMRWRRLRAQTLIGALVVATVAILAAWQQQLLKEGIYWIVSVRPYVLTAERERALKPKDLFKECTDCPEMVVVPAGNFLMGSPALDGRADEHPQHRVTISKPFAVAKFEL
jgi:hypothetical protein